MTQTDLDRIQIASPCDADWDAMQGDDRVRFCSQCELNVYNLSAMQRPEAEAFVRESEGKACIRMYKRRDGTLITQDCPVGLRAALRRKLSWLAGLAASLLATVGGVFAGARSAEQSASNTPPRRPLPIAVPVDPEPPTVPESFEVPEVPDCELPPDVFMGAMVEVPPPGEPDVADHPDDVEVLMGGLSAEDFEDETTVEMGR